MRLEEVKSRIQSQFEREPTLVEWAEAVGLSCRALKLQLHQGNSSREKLIYANFRMVVHIAKRYQGRGLNLQDLLQVNRNGYLWDMPDNCFSPKNSITDKNKVGQTLIVCMVFGCEKYRGLSVGILFYQHPL